MTIGMRAWQKVISKLERCKVKQRSYSNQAYLCLGVAIPCVLAAAGEIAGGTYLTLNSLGAVVFALSGGFFLKLESVTQQAKGASIDSVIEDMTDLLAGFQSIPLITEHEGRE